MLETEELSIESSKQTEPARDGQPKKATRPKKSRSSRPKGGGGRPTARLSFPKHAISKCLRIPQAVLEQNAGKECSDRDAAKFANIGYTGVIGVEISSALKYGLLERPSKGTVKPTRQTSKAE